MLTSFIHLITSMSSLHPFTIPIHYIYSPHLFTTPIHYTYSLFVTTLFILSQSYYSYHHHHHYHSLMYHHQLNQCMFTTPSRSAPHVSLIMHAYIHAGSTTRTPRNACDRTHRTTRKRTALHATQRNATQRNATQRNATQRTHIHYLKVK